MNKPQGGRAKLIAMWTAWWSENSAAAKCAALLFTANLLFERMVLMIHQAKYTALCEFDCDWYRSILERGYDVETQGQAVGHAANWAFFPIFPLLSEATSSIGLGDETALLITSRVTFLIALFCFIKFVSAYNERVSPMLAGAVVAFSPYALYGGVGYTEPLYLAFTSMAFFHLGKGNYIRAGLFGAALGATRFVGAAFGFSYLIKLFRAEAWRWPREAQLRAVFGLGLVPLGLAIFAAFLYARMGDAIAFIHIQRAWGRQVGSAWQIFTDGFRAGGPEAVFSSMSLFGMFAAVILAARKRYEMALFSLLAVLIPLSTSLASMPRYVLWQAPILLVLVEMLSFRRLWVLFFPLALLGLSQMYSLWLIRHGFTI